MERSITPDSLKTKLDDLHVLDVRRLSDIAVSSEKLPGAHWHDPEKITEWMNQLPRDKNIVLYCVRGGSVSNGVVDTLQAQGFKARFVEGGIEGWKAAGGQTHPK